MAEAPVDAGRQSLPVDQSSAGEQLSQVFDR